MAGWLLSSFHWLCVQTLCWHSIGVVENGWHGSCVYFSPLPSVTRNGYPSSCQFFSAEVYTTFTQTSGTAVSGRRRLTPGGHSAARAGEIMSNKEVLFKEVGVCWKGEWVSRCQAFLGIQDLFFCAACFSVWDQVYSSFPSSFPAFFSPPVDCAWHSAWCQRKVRKMHL